MKQETHYFIPAYRISLKFTLGSDENREFTLNGIRYVQLSSRYGREIDRVLVSVSSGVRYAILK